MKTSRSLVDTGLGRFIALSIACAGLTACDWLPQEYKPHWTQFKREWDAMVVVLQGGESPLAKASPQVAQASPSPGVPQGEYASFDANRAKVNAEILQEMFRVVLLRDPKDRAEFGSYVDTLNQGASLEGVYNGYTHSNDYRKLELTYSGASSEALTAFAQELAELELELPEPKMFDEKAAKPLAMPVQPGVDIIPAKAQELKFGAQPSPQPSSKWDAKALADQYSKTFVGASIFTLKRLIGDEALELVTSKKDSPEKLALWYSQWAVRKCARNVDFGLALRNKADEQFHYQWALSAGEDRIKWEVLNRLHRILNEANRQKQ